MIDSSKQDSDEETKNLIEDLTAMIKLMMDQIKFGNNHQTRMMFFVVHIGCC